MWQWPGRERLDAKWHPWIIAGLVLAFIALFLSVNGWIIRHDRDLAFSDGHFSRAANTFEYLKTGDRTFLERHGEPVFSAKVPSPDRFPRFCAYPPVTYLVTALYFAHGGVSLVNARLSLLPFSALLLLALFGIGLELGGSAAGLAAMALGAAAPQVLYISRLYLLDLPQTAMTGAALYVLLRTRGYRDRRMTLLYGAVLALTFLTKWSAGLFLCLPTVWFILPAFDRDRRTWMLALAGLCLATTLSAAVWLSYQRCVDPRTWVDEGRWLWYCLATVELPLAVFALGLRKLEQRWLTRPGYRESGAWRVAGFHWMSLWALAATAPWYFWALGDLRANLLVNADHASIAGGWTTALLMWRVLARFFPAASVLLPLGVLTALALRQGRSVRLLFLLNLLLTAGVLFQTGQPENFNRINFQNRLILSMVLFAAPLSSFWIGRTGPLRWPLAGGCLALSVALLTGWMWSPDRAGGLERLWGSYARVFFSPLSVGDAPPEIAPPPPLLEMLASLDKPGRPFETALLMPGRSLPWELNWEASYVGALARSHKILARADQLQWVGDDYYHTLLIKQRERFKNLDYVVFLKPPRWNPQPFLSALKEVWPAGGAFAKETRLAPGVSAIAVQISHPLEP